MQKRLIIDRQLTDIIISRLCQQLVENHADFEETVLIGLQPRGIHLAQRILKVISETLGHDVPYGQLDTTFYRDDFRRRESPIRANTTNIPFVVEDKRVVLIDDVLYTGRSVRAALDAMTAFGRSKNVELLVFIDRKYSRDLPIEANYVGRQVNTLNTQKVLVEWKGVQEAEADSVWLIDRESK